MDGVGVDDERGKSREYLNWEAGMSEKDYKRIVQKKISTLEIMCAKTLHKNAASDIIVSIVSILGRAILS